MAHLLDQTPSSSVEAAQLFASAALLQDGDDNEDYSTINRFILRVGLLGFLIKMLRSLNQLSILKKKCNVFYLFLSPNSQLYYFIAMQAKY